MLQRHLLRRVALPALGVAGALALVAWALQVVRAAPQVFTDATPPHLVLRVMLLPLVPLVSFVLPVGAAAGILVAGRSLAAEGTLDMLASSGISSRRVVQPFLVVALASAAVSAALSLAAEPLALAALRSDAPRLAATTFAGRIAPGVFAPAGPDADVFARAASSGEWHDALLVHRGRPGDFAEAAARTVRLRGTAEGAIAADLTDGAMRAEGPYGRVEASFGTLRLSPDVAAIRAAIGRMLPPGLAASPGAVLDPAAQSRLSVRDGYLLLRRWAAPLQTLLLALLAAGLAVGGRIRAGGSLLLAGAVLCTFALLRVLEPGGPAGLPGAWALLVPHAPLAVVAFLQLRCLYLAGPV
jgi:hypothetical protein